MQDHITLTIVALSISRTRGGSSEPVAELSFRPESGIIGDSHTKDAAKHYAGPATPNMRQFTAVSAGELDEMAKMLGVPYIAPIWLKANICFACTQENFTGMLVEGAKLQDLQGRPMLEVKGAIDPCTNAGEVVAAQFPHINVDARLFPKAAYGRRGVYGIALAEATIKVGDTFIVDL